MNDFDYEKEKEITKKEEGKEKQLEKLLEEQKKQEEEIEKLKLELKK